MPTEKERITAYVSKQLMKTVKLWCVRKGWSISKLVEELLTRVMEEEKGK